jgi:hypothetical protein
MSVCSQAASQRAIVHWYWLPCLCWSCDSAHLARPAVLTRLCQLQHLHLLLLLLLLVVVSRSHVRFREQSRFVGHRPCTKQDALLLSQREHQQHLQLERRL